MKIALTAASMAALLISGHAQAQTAEVVTQWNFNSSSTAPSIGLGTISLVGGVTNPGYNNGAGSSDTALSNLGFQTTSYTVQGTGNNTAGVQFNVSTLGYEDVVIGYDLRHSNTSSRYEQVQYSLDGISFVDIATFNGGAGDTWFNNRTVDLSGITGASNNESFAFRVVSTYAPGSTGYEASRFASSSYAAGGTWRFDMVTISAVSAVPEPETHAMLLAGLGLVGAFTRRRKAQAGQA